jgi:hypothetical protein
MYLTMEEPEEQCTVVFAFMDTESASDSVGEMGGGGGVAAPPLLPNNRFRNNLCKDDIAWFSRFPHVFNLLGKSCSQIHSP